MEWGILLRHRHWGILVSVMVLWGILQHRTLPLPLNLRNVLLVMVSLETHSFVLTLLVLLLRSTSTDYPRLTPACVMHL